MPYAHTRPDAHTRASSRSVSVLLLCVVSPAPPCRENETKNVLFFPCIVFKNEIFLLAVRNSPFSSLCFDAEALGYSCLWLSPLPYLFVLRVMLLRREWTCSQCLGETTAIRGLASFTDNPSAEPHWMAEDRKFLDGFKILFFFLPSFSFFLQKVGVNYLQIFALNGIILIRRAYLTRPFEGAPYRSRTGCLAACGCVRAWCGRASPGEPR